MSETPEILKAEIAALEEKLAEAEAVAPVEPEVEVVAAPESDTAVAEEIAEEIAEVLAAAEETTGAVIVVTASAPAVTHHVHAAQTAPARWALQPLAR